jgi:tetratricopeptide (TPR) repeat protein
MIVPNEIWGLISSFIAYPECLNISFVTKIIYLSREVEKNVRYLDLNDRTEISINQLKHVKINNISVIKMNAFTGNTLKNYLLSRLFTATNLVKLKFNNMLLLDNSFLMNLTCLKSLSMSACYIGTEEDKHPLEIKYMSTLTQLRKIDISNVGLENNDLGYFNKFICLESLNISSNYHITEEGIKYLFHLTNIMDLDIRDTPNINDKAKFWKKKGETLYNNQKYLQSLDCFNDALLTNPNDRKCLVFIARLNAKLKNINGSIECYNKAIDIEPKVELFLEKAKVLRKFGRYKDTLECFDKVLSLDPKNIRAWFRKGIVLFKLAKNEEALYCLKKVSELRRHNDSFFQSKGYASDDLIKDIPCYYKDFVNFLQGDILFELNQKIEAMQLYYNSIKLNNDHPDVLNEVNPFRSYQDTLQLYTKVLHLNENDESVWYTMGLIYASLNNYDIALQCLDKTIHINQTFSAAYDRRGEILLKLGKYNDALHNFSQSLLHDEYRFKAWINKMKLLKKLNQHHDIEILLSQANQILDHHSVETLIDIKNEPICCY